MSSNNGLTLTLRYPQHLLTPEDFVRFVEIPPFSAHWKKLGLSDDDLLMLQAGIMAAPLQGDVVRGTGGLRKLRFAKEGSGRGKSGGCRVYYCYLEEFSSVLLLAAYEKSRKEDLSMPERLAIKQVVERIVLILKSRGE